MKHFVGVFLVVAWCTYARAHARADAPACTEDATLSEVARAFANAQEVPPSSELVRAVQQAGIDATPVYAKFGLSSEPAALTSWLADLRSKADAPMLCGRATVGERAVLITAVRAGELRMVGKRKVRTVLAPGFGEPYLVVRGEGEPMRRVSVHSGSDEAVVTLPREWGARLFLQLVATGPQGPRPIAERWLGGLPKRASEPLPTDSPPSWHAKLRKGAGAPVVRVNRLLSEEAQAHAQAVCQAGRVAHELDARADPESRLRARGLQARVVGEAIARADTLPNALRAIEDSPSHRLTIVDPRFTDAGYGTATDDKERTCVVVLLAAWPRRTP